jgi:hypothetical protein
MFLAYGADVTAISAKKGLFKSVPLCALCPENYLISLELEEESFPLPSSAFYPEDRSGQLSFTFL